MAAARACNASEPGGRSGCPGRTTHDPPCAVCPMVPHSGVPADTLGWDGKSVPAGLIIELWNTTVPWSKSKWDGGHGNNRLREG
jgi:hypothetical protein